MSHGWLKASLNSGDENHSCEKQRTSQYTGPLESLGGRERTGDCLLIFWIVALCKGTVKELSPMILVPGAQGNNTFALSNSGKFHKNTKTAELIF